MTKKQDFIRTQQAAGWLTTEQAATLTGRKAGGNIVRLMARHNVPTIQCNGFRLYLKHGVDKVPKLTIKGYRWTGAGEYIDRECKGGKGRQDELPLDRNPITGQLESCPIEKPLEKPADQPEKTDAEKLDGVEVSPWRLCGEGETRVSLLWSGTKMAHFACDKLISLSRQIIARIDGPAVKPPNENDIKEAFFQSPNILAVAREIVRHVDGDYKSQYEAELSRRMKLETELMNLAERIREQG